jgi:hypothetical protein
MEKLTHEEFHIRVMALAEELVNQLSEKNVNPVVISAALGSAYATFCIAASMNPDTFKLCVESLIQTFNGAYKSLHDKH